MSIGKIDVCCCTKEKELPEWWYRQLKRIPVNKLIIDRSVPLAVSRMNAIQKVETEWFAFIDDDVLVGENWFKEITSHIKPKVGAIAGREQIVGLGKKWDDELNAFRWSKGTRELKIGERGTTVNTLIRTDLVKDWKPSRPDLSAWEDYEITQHILKKGYKWLEVNAHATHYGWTWMILPGKTCWHAEGQKKIIPPGRLYPPRYVFHAMLTPPIYFIKAFLRMAAHAIHYKRNLNFNYCGFRLAAYLTWHNFWIILGLLRT